MWWIKKIIGLLLLLLLGLEFTSELSSYYDLNTYDELNYLWSGLKLGDQPIAADWGPLYSVQYWVLSQFTDGKLELFYLNQRLIIILLPICVYLLFAMRIKHRYALLLSLTVLYMDANILSFTKINNMGTIVLLLGGMLLLNRRRSFFQTALALVAVLGFLSYMRPEYYLFFIMCFVGFAGYVLATTVMHRTWGRFAALLLIGGIWLGLSYTIGQPVDGARSLFAFEQTFAQNQYELQGIPNEIPDYETISERVFGPIESMGDAIQANPQAVLQHFWYNATRSIRLTVWKLIDITIPRALLTDSLSSDLFATRVAAIFGLLALSLALSKRAGEQGRLLPIVWYLYMLIIVGVGYLSCVLFYPDERYLTPVVLFVLATLGFVATNKLQFRHTAIGVVLPLVLFALLAINRPHGSDYFDGTQLNKTVFTQLDQLQFEYEDVMLVPELFYGLTYQPAMNELYDSTAITNAVDPAVRAIITINDIPEVQNRAFNSIEVNDSVAIFYRP